MTPLSEMSRDDETVGFHTSVFESVESIVKCLSFLSSPKCKLCDSGIYKDYWFHLLKQSFPDHISTKNRKDKIFLGTDQ